MSLALIGGMLGHKSVQTTNRYAHLYSSSLKAAANKTSTSLSKAIPGSWEVKEKLTKGIIKEIMKIEGPIFVTANSPINDIDIDYIRKAVLSINFSKASKEYILN